MTVFSSAEAFDARRRFLSVRGMPELAVGILSVATTFLILQPATRIVAASVLAALLGVAALAFAFTRPVAAVLSAWVLLVLQAVAAGLAGAVSDRVGTMVSHIDEVTLATLVIALSLRRFAGVTPQATAKPHRLMVWSVCGFVGLGLLSSFLAGPGPQTVLGLWYALKFWLVLWLSLCVPWTKADIERAFRLTTVVGLFVAFCGVIDFVAPGPLRAILHTGGGPIRSFRAGAVQSVFAQPGAFAEFMSLVFALSAAHYVLTRKRASLLSAGAFLLMSLLSLRLKSVLVPLAVLIVLVTWRSAGVRRRAVPVTLFVLVCFIVALPLYGSAIAGQAQKFTSSAGETPRGKLYTVGADVAVQRFPLGAGFGRYGEYAATYRYSPIYQQHGFQFIYGLSPTRSQQLTDTSWPAVYGETGMLGMGFYGLGIVTLLRDLRRRRRSADRTGAMVPAVVVLVAFLVDSLGAPTIFNSLYVLTVAIFAGAALGASRPGVSVANPMTNDLSRSGKAR